MKVTAFTLEKALRFTLYVMVLGACWRYRLARLLPAKTRTRKA